MRQAIYLTLLAALTACGKKTETTEAKPGSADKPPPPPPAEPTPALTVKDRLAVPESALPVAELGGYLVSNIVRGPADVDDNGTIVLLKPDGTVTPWVDGAAAEVKLDGPKGMALVGETLYVSDISIVRRFELKTAKQLPDVPIPGTTFLNDMVADGAGGVYVSDSGLNAKLEPTETDAVYRIDKDGKVSTVIKDKGLGKPNGLVVDDKGVLWVVTFGTGEMFSLDAAGTKSASSKLPKGSLDGIVLTPSGEFLVSSWEAKAVYRGKPGAWKEAFTGLESPADIGFDATSGLLLVPLFTKDQLLAFKLP